MASKKELRNLLVARQLEINGYIEKNAYNPGYVPSHSAVAYKQMLCAQDSAECASRYIWRRLPWEITSQQFELLLYYNKSICAFEERGRLVPAKYAKVGALNVIGQLERIKPIGFNGKSYNEVYSVVTSGARIKPGEKVAVILNDYSGGIDDNAVPRSVINLNSTIADEVAVYEQLFCNVFLSAKKALALVDSEDQANIMRRQIKQMFDPSNPVIVVTKRGGKSAVDDILEMFNFTNNFDTQNYCQQIDFYNKTRRMFNGIPAPDTFEKKERKITAESENTTVGSNLVLADGLMNRVYWLELCKKYLPVDGLENATVEINPVLLQGESEQAEEGREDVR